MLLKKSQGTHPTKVYLHIHDYPKYPELEMTGFAAVVLAVVFVVFFFTFKITENKATLSMHVLLILVSRNCITEFFHCVGKEKLKTPSSQSPNDG